MVILEQKTKKIAIFLILSAKLNTKEERKRKRRHESVRAAALNNGGLTPLSLLIRAYDFLKESLTICLNSSDLSKIDVTANAANEAAIGANNRSPLK